MRRPTVPIYDEKEVFDEYTEKWWILCGVVAVLLIVGIWAFFTYGPVNRVVSAREAEAYRVYDITLPEGESSAFSYILSQCTAFRRMGSLSLPMFPGTR